jgi:hypothetical protein
MKEESSGVIGLHLMSEPLKLEVEVSALPNRQLGKMEQMAIQKHR